MPKMIFSKKIESKRRALAANAADLRREAKSRAERGDTDGEALWAARMKAIETEIAALVGG